MFFPFGECQRLISRHGIVFYANVYGINTLSISISTMYGV